MSNSHETERSGLSNEDFRRCLSEFGTGVTVITTQVEGEPYGMTSNSFASVSLDPPLVLWSIRRESTSFEAFRSCEHFAVNILADGQIPLSQRFAKSGPEKFSDLAWQEGVGGAPLLDDVVAQFQCRAHSAFDGGDHVILVGEVLGSERFAKQPLLFSKGRYAVAVDHPDTKVFPQPDLPRPEGINEQLLSLMLVRAYSVVAKRLEEGRRIAGVGLSLMQARLLKAIQMFPDRTLEALLPEVLGDMDGAMGYLQALESAELVTLDAAGRIRLTSAGMARLCALVEHTNESERLLFKDIPRKDLETVQNVLSKIIAEGNALS